MKSNHKHLNLKILILLTLLLALPITTTDIYLPSIYSIQDFFKSDIFSVQLTLTVYFIVFSCIQLIYGFLSDLFGRKIITLWSLAIYILGTLICIVSQTIETLIAGRIIQALGAGSAITVFAVIRDSYESVAVARIISYMSAVVAISPIIAPIIGGFLQTIFCWQANFIFLLLVSIILFLSAVYILPETKRHSQIGGAKTLITNYVNLAINTNYIPYAFGAAFAFGALFSYISGAPHIFLNLLGYSPEHFAIVFAIAAIGYVFGSLINPKLINIFGINKVLYIGIINIIFGGIIMCLFCLYTDNAVLAFGIIASQLICEFGISVTVPICTTKALQPVPENAGQASALIGFMRFICAALASILMSQLQHPVFMALIILLFGILAWISVQYQKHRWKEL